MGTLFLLLLLPFLGLLLRRTLTLAARPGRPGPGWVWVRRLLTTAAGAAADPRTTALAVAGPLLVYVRGFDPQLLVPLQEYAGVELVRTLGEVEWAVRHTVQEVVSSSLEFMKGLGDHRPAGGKIRQGHPGVLFEGRFYPRTHGKGIAHFWAQFPPSYGARLGYLRSTTGVGQTMGHLPLQELLRLWELRRSASFQPAVVEAVAQQLRFIRWTDLPPDTAARAAAQVGQLLTGGPRPLGPLHWVRLLWDLIPFQEIFWRDPGGTVYERRLIQLRPWQEAALQFRFHGPKVGPALEPFRSLAVGSPLDPLTLPTVEELRALVKRGVELRAQVQQPTVAELTALVDQARELVAERAAEATTACKPPSPHDGSPPPPAAGAAAW